MKGWLPSVSSEDDVCDTKEMMRILGAGSDFRRRTLKGHFADCCHTHNHHNFWQLCMFSYLLPNFISKSGKCDSTRLFPWEFSIPIKSWNICTFYGIFVLFINLFLHVLGILIFAVFKQDDAHSLQSTLILNLFDPALKFLKVLPYGTIY